MNALFGLELPTSVNFVIAFVVVLGLIGAATWAVRRFGGTRLEAAVRNRQPRLAVVDSAVIDGRRRLVIVRRDNVEHLLVIGGGSDLVVETNIVRASAAGREPAPSRAGAAETLPRAMPLPDATPWPLQPEPAVASPPVRAERSRNGDDVAAWPTPEPAPDAPVVRAVRPPDPLAGLTAGLPRPVQAEPPAPARPVAPAVNHDTPAAAADDQDLEDMAYRLEAALRRPAATAPTASRPAPPAVTRLPEPKPAPRAEQKPDPRPTPPPPAAQPKSAFKSLEQEMASLLGRPGKT